MSAVSFVSFRSASGGPGMADRFVTHTRKDAQSAQITRLCNHDEAWSPTRSLSAIIEIDAKINCYFVKWDDQTTRIEVASGPTGRYLRTDHDDTTRNNLLDLPDC
jgi:hypothetical protein